MGIKQKGDAHARNQLAWAIVAALALGMTACSSGGGSSSAPPLTIGTGGDGGGTTPTPTPTPNPTVPPAPLNLQPPIDAHLKLTGADQAIAAGYRGAGVTIGIIDTGVRRDHPTLAGRVKANFVHVDSPPNDLSVDDKVGHGTTVASLAAGSAFGMWPGGIAQGANIVSSRIINDARPSDDGSGQGNQVSAGEGIGPFFRAINTELADAGARIINNSWGGLYWSDPRVTAEFVDAYSDYILSRDGLVVFANGNAGTDPRYRPNPSDNAALPSKSADAAVLERGWLTVAALNPTEATPTLTDYSQACGIAKNYCLTAPGNVVYTGLNDTPTSPSYYWGGGTSYSAPLVAGTAALVWSAFPYFNNDLVRQTVLGTATDIGAEGVDEVFGYGLLNAAKAVRGPGRFDWGDVSVAFSGSSTWGNVIAGNGGLIKGGSGTLILADRSSYSGETVVNAGLLSARRGLVNSSVKIMSGGNMEVIGNIGGSVANAGFLAAGDATTAMSVSGDFTQEDSGLLSLWIGNPLGIDKTAKLDGTLYFAGLRPGYTASSKEVVLYTKQGLSGTFKSVGWASNLTLVNQRLSYDLLNVYLETSRINVSFAAQAWGLSALSQEAATRIEAAMQAIDRQLQSPVGGPTGTGFIDGMGAFQQAQGVGGVDLSLRSLSGQLYGASSALTYDSIDAARRVAGNRFGTFRNGKLATGSWYSDLSRNGALAQAGFDGIGYASNGEVIGHDVQIGQNALVGVAFSRQQQQSWLAAMGDQMRGHQNEGQLYAGWMRDGWYAQGRVGFGQFDRDMQRNLLLGGQVESVSSTLSGRYLNANAESGYRLGLGALQLTPYAGVQYTRLHNDGFSEGGGAGLGLRANAWDSARSQGYLGLRGEHSWQLSNGLRLGMDLRGEWQQRLASQGELFDASFVGIDQWQPLYGIGLAERSRLFGLGFNASWSKHLLRLDYSRRSSDRDSAAGVNLLYQHGF